MARKSRRVIEPEMSQGELEEEMTKHTRVVGLEGPSQKGRVRRASAVPSGDAPTGDIVEVISMTLQVNADSIGWDSRARSEKTLEATAKQWAEIVLRDIRYGIPYDEVGGEGWHIREDASLGEPPTCESCEEELAA